MSTNLEAIDKAELRALLLRNWMTHDAMWFMNAVRSLGIDKANELNRAAVRGMAAVEAKRLCKILGVSQVGTPDEMRQFFDTAIELVIPDFIEFSWKWAPDNRSVRFEITKCFAHDGVIRLGVADAYECGIYERIYGWFDALGVAYTVTPDVVRCTMHHDGECVRDLRVAFRGARSRSRR